MAMRQFVLVTVLSVVAATAGGPASADVGDHWCSLPFTWASRTYVPVWIHPDVADYMRHPDGSPWSDSELATEVKLVLERFMDQAPTGMPPLRYMGFEYSGTAWDAPAGNGPGGSPGEWNVAIRPKLGGTTCVSDMDYSPTQNGKRIEIVPSVAPCAGGPVYVHWKFPSGPTTGDV